VRSRLRVFVATASDEDRRRLRGDAARAGWVPVDNTDDADLFVGTAAEWSRLVSRNDTEAGRARPERPVESLTAREREVLVLLAEGVGNRTIASRLGISEHTVKFHLGAIFGKLGAATRTDAVRRALRLGLIDL
jgi:DNA-binding NarL/FixJ family response regulator